MHDVVVIGAGLAGLSAAQAAIDAGARVAILESDLTGGLITNVNELDPNPDATALNGADLAARLSQAVADRGVEERAEAVETVEIGPDGLRIRTSTGELAARQIVVASGARLRTLGIPGEEEFDGRGVSRCADCDGAFFSGEDVVVVGSGDSALQEALVLSAYCRRIHLVHHGERLTGRPDLAARVIGQTSIARIPNAQPERIEGSEGVERVVIRRLDSEERIAVPCKGIFVYVGLAPNTGFLPEAMARDGDGRLLTDDALRTTVAGAYAAGIVRAGCGGTLLDAIRDGRTAGAAAADAALADRGDRSQRSG